MSSTAEGFEGSDKYFKVLSRYLLGEIVDNHEKTGDYCANRTLPKHCRGYVTSVCWTSRRLYLSEKEVAEGGGGGGFRPVARP
jgi:hypothetical protein